MVDDTIDPSVKGRHKFSHPWHIPVFLRIRAQYLVTEITVGVLWDQIFFWLLFLTTKEDIILRQNVHW